MSAPYYGFDVEGQDPYAVAGPSPGAAPTATPESVVPGITPQPTGQLPSTPPAAPEPTVMTPLGQLPPAALPPTPGDPPPVDAVSGGAPVPAGGVTPPDAAPGAPVTAAGAAPAPADVPAGPPPRPVRPPLTGDAQKDIANSLAYERNLEDWHTATQEHNAKAAAGITAKHAADELAAVQAETKSREELQAKHTAERAERQGQIDAAVKRSIAEQGNLESGAYRGNQSVGSKIASALAILAGGLGAGLSAAGGHPTGNLALEQFNKMEDAEYQRAKDRLATANEHVLAARYGYKDTEDNQRAAKNDLDAHWAARHKLIAAEAANELAKNGLSPEQTAQHELVAGSLAKSAQYEDNIHAREIEAGRKNELADATIGKEKAQADAAEALAGWRNRRHDKATAAGAGKGAGGLSKAEAKAQKDELKDIEHAADKEGSVILGSAKSQGAKVAYESAQAVANELRRAAASGDPDAMKIAVMHAQEQSTRFLTGAAPTQQTFEIQHGLAGSAEQLESKFGGWIGQPTEAKSYVLRMAQNIDAIARQRKEVLTQEGEGLKTRLESIVKSDEGKRRAQGVLDQFLGKGAVKLGGATAGESGLTPQQEAALKSLSKLGFKPVPHPDAGNIKL